VPNRTRQAGRPHSARGVSKRNSKARAAQRDRDDSPTTPATIPPALDRQLQGLGIDPIEALTEIARAEKWVEENWADLPKRLGRADGWVDLNPLASVSLRNLIAAWKRISFSLRLTESERALFLALMPKTRAGRPQGGLYPHLLRVLIRGEPARPEVGLLHIVGQARLLASGAHSEDEVKHLIRGTFRPGFVPWDKWPGLRDRLAHEIGICSSDRVVALVLALASEAKLADYQESRKPLAILKSALEIERLRNSDVALKDSAQRVASRLPRQTYVGLLKSIRRLLGGDWFSRTRT
jgi:hypothetical protein